MRSFLCPAVYEGGSHSSSRSIFINSSMVSWLVGVSSNSVSLRQKSREKPMALSLLPRAHPWFWSLQGRRPTYPSAEHDSCGKPTQFKSYQLFCISLKMFSSFTWGGCSCTQACIHATTHKRRSGDNLWVQFSPIMWVLRTELRMSALAAKAMPWLAVPSWSLHL